MPAASRSPDRPHWEPPSTFDQFSVERPLGSGGMGHVYLGHDTALDRPIALKFISTPDPSADARSRFIVEARSIAKLSHPNVVGVYRVGEIDGHPYIAYEFVAGQSLDKLVKPTTWETTLRLAVGLARGLAATHAIGILHRDIKPGNVVLSDRGEVKLLDFGLAKLGVEPDDDDDTDPLATVGGDDSTKRVRTPRRPGPRSVRGGALALTLPGTVMGTPAYLSPELWRGEPASSRSDVFAAGLVLYELLTGRLPHAHLDFEAMAIAMLERELPDVRTLHEAIPESLAAIVSRCLRHDPAERFASAADLSRALEEVQNVFLPASGAVTAVQVEPDRLAIAASLARVSTRKVALTDRMYDRLFTASPDARKLFPEDLTAQQDKLAHALKLAVDGLADPERLAPILEDLGRRHVRYGVSPEHFTLLETALLGALAEIDAAGWSPELERAWRRAFAFIESAMRRGMQQEHATVASGPAVRAIRRRQATSSSTDVPRTRYAPSGELSLAYQVIGDGPVDVVLLLGWLSHVEIGWQHPSLAGFIRELARFSRVILFDKRGTGMSDRAFESLTVEDRVDDLEAVLDHVGSKSAVLFGVSEGALTAALFAAMQPSRVRGLVLYGGTPRLLSAPDYPFGHAPEFMDSVVSEIRSHWGEAVFVDLEAPSMVDDSEFSSWLALFMRMSASPGTAIAMLRLNARLDLRGLLPLVRVPTLVLHRRGDRISPVGAGKLIAEGIPGARFVELAGDDHLPFVGDTASLLGEVERFVSGVPEAPATVPPVVALLTVMPGPDNALRDGFVRACEELATALDGRSHGNGVVAFTFDGGVRALRCARALLNLAAREGVPMSIGLDAGPRAVTSEDPVPSALAESAALGTARVSDLIEQLAAGSSVTLERSGVGFVLRAAAPEQARAS